MPNLYELRPLPTEVGGVPIVWFDPKKEEGEKRLARRDKRELRLPNSPESVFLPLGNKRKLLFIDNSVPSNAGSRNSFCGTDESPFHVFVMESAVAAYKEGGSDRFFESLVPNVMKRLRSWPDIPDDYVRQGDWFANRLPFSWEGIEQFIRLGRGKGFGAEEVKKVPLGGTRHHFTGRLARNVSIFGWECTVLEGVILAPDHSPLVLSGGPHVIAQTANLADPKNAD